MGVCDILTTISRTLVVLVVIVALLLFIPNLPPQANFSKPITTAPAIPITGNVVLNDVEIWHKGYLTGPENFAELNGELYTGIITNGDIVKLTGENQITPVVKFGKPCNHLYEDYICGRTLGMEFDKNGLLLAMDAYYGLFRVNVTTGEKEQLVSPDDIIDGKPSKIFNSVTSGSNGDIFWTVSSTEFLLYDGSFVLLADPTGRLIRYNAETKQNEVLIDGIQFANGVALSKDEEFVIVAETAQSRIHRYYLKGPKKGTHDIFIDGLPGLPDNLRADGNGGFLVPLIVSRDDAHLAITQTIGPYPVIRKAIARFLGVVQYGFNALNSVYPSEFLVQAARFVGDSKSATLLFTSTRTTLMRVDRKGQITSMVHTFNKTLISGISEMKIFGDQLILGSPYNDYIGRIPLAKLGWDDLVQPILIVDR